MLDHSQNEKIAATPHLNTPHAANFSTMPYKTQPKTINTSKHSSRNPLKLRPITIGDRPAIHENLADIAPQGEYKVWFFRRVEFCLQSICVQQSQLMLWVRCDKLSESLVFF
jgi:hypothetical protein